MFAVGHRSLIRNCPRTTECPSHSICEIIFKT